MRPLMIVLLLTTVTGPIFAQHRSRRSRARWGLSRRPSSRRAARPDRSTTAPRPASPTAPAPEASKKKPLPKIVTDEFQLKWHTNYSDAYAKAKEEKKLLVVAFDSQQTPFTPDLETADALRGLVLARLRIADSEKLLSRSSFRLFHQAPGIGVIDLKNQGNNYGHVVQVLPSRYLTSKGVRAMLATAGGHSKLPELPWLTDYQQARDLAIKEEKMLLIAIDGQATRFEPKPKSIPVLHGYVLLRQNAKSQVESKGKLRRLLTLGDLRPMREKTGLVVYDFRHKGEPYYGQIVSAMPFKYLGPNPGNRVVGEEERQHEFFLLEPNTLTRRTLTWAIRVSKGYGTNQRLRSADGRPSRALMSWALKNSRLQCRYGCGHHAGGPMRSEIASPGPGDDLVDGALNMVRIWRSSPPHYSTMVSYHRQFGYDMHPRSNTRWYGTGRF